MNQISAKAGELFAALRTVDRLRVYEDLGAIVDPPGALVGPPRLQWEAYCAEPTTATFVVIVGVALDERATETLFELVPLAADALANVEDATVATATPGVFNSNGTDLASYEITVEVSL
jgi:hypothetical protein